MVGRKDGDLGDRRKSVAAGFCDDISGRCAGNERLVAQLLVQRHIEPVGVIVARRLAPPLVLAPGREAGEELVLGSGDPVLARHGGMATGQQRIGLGKERAQQLPFPAVPHAGADGADVADGEDEQQLQAFRALHDGGEIEDRLEVVEVAHLRRFAHQQVMADQPGDGFGFRRVKAKARAEAEGNAFARDGMVLRPAFGDVVEQRRHIERPSGGEGGKEAHRQGMIARKRAGLDLPQHAHGADQVLIDGVVVIHVELHHRHDLAEVGNEAAQHARLVHQAKHRFRIIRAREDVEEDGVGIRAVAHVFINEPQ
jgi:hypothetical protein